jgi:hypothetical protein
LSTILLVLFNGISDFAIESARPIKARYPAGPRFYRDFPYSYKDIPLF